ncbi:MAG TPA: D-aminoacylase [Bryobacteraceae bacterium]|nr:D-aminoacylase [Bryobacteraceae bacterium]
MIAVLLAAAVLSGQAPQFDVLITGARVVDGSGGPWYVADVGVRGDVIVSVGRLRGASASLTLPGRGLVLSPGFIDPHTHSQNNLLSNPLAENFVRQGVTTIIDGNDGISAYPVGAFLATLRGIKLGVNVATFIGHGKIREAVLGLENRKPTANELTRMRQLTSEAMLEGAVGLSTGLFYVPGNYATTEEVISLARVAGELGGLHISHIRDEGDRVVESVREAIRIGEEGDLPTQITHHKANGYKNWGKTKDTLQLVDEARQRGVDVTLDVYPYTAGFGPSTSLFPQWALEGGQKSLVTRLADKDTRLRVKQGVANILREYRRPHEVVMARCPQEPELEGKTLAQVTESGGAAPTVENAAETALRIQEKGGCWDIWYMMEESDVERVLRRPETMIGSDGAPGDYILHPRSYGTFVRILGTFVRDRKVLTLEEAVRRMSALPANRFGFRDRGLIRPGMKADLVLFNPVTVADKSTYERPKQHPEGVSHVLVNGRLVIRDGIPTNERPGVVLYGPAHGRP